MPAITRCKHCLEEVFYPRYEDPPSATFYLHKVALQVRWIHHDLGEEGIVYTDWHPKSAVNFGLCVAMTTCHLLGPKGDTYNAIDHEM